MRATNRRIRLIFRLALHSLHPVGGFDDCRHVVRLSQEQAREPVLCGVEGIEGGGAHCLTSTTHNTANALTTGSRMSLFIGLTVVLDC